jgi:hypothetical protein
VREAPDKIGPDRRRSSLAPWVLHARSGQVLVAATGPHPRRMSPSAVGTRSCARPAAEGLRPAGEPDPARHRESGERDPGEHHSGDDVTNGVHGSPLTDRAVCLRRGSHPRPCRRRGMGRIARTLAVNRTCTGALPMEDRHARSACPWWMGDRRAMFTTAPSTSAIGAAASSATVPGCLRSGSPATRLREARSSLRGEAPPTGLT